MLKDSQGRPLCQLIVQADLDGGIRVNLTAPEGCALDPCLTLAYEALAWLADGTSEGGGSDDGDGDGGGRDEKRASPTGPFCH